MPYSTNNEPNYRPQSPLGETVAVICIFIFMGVAAIYIWNYVATFFVR